MSTSPRVGLWTAIEVAAAESFAESSRHTALHMPADSTCPCGWAPDPRAQDRPAALAEHLAAVAREVEDQCDRRLVELLGWE